MEHQVLFEVGIEFLLDLDLVLLLLFLLANAINDELVILALCRLVLLLPRSLLLHLHVQPAAHLLVLPPSVLVSLLLQHLLELLPPLLEFFQLEVIEVGVSGGSVGMLREGDCWDSVEQHVDAILSRFSFSFTSRLFRFHQGFVVMVC